MAHQLKIVIADDHPIFREGLSRILNKETAIKIVGQAGNGGDALHLIKTLKPDIGILDISMPIKNGLEIVQEIRSLGQKIDFIIMTMYREEEYFNHALDCGVKGYLLKENAADELLNCIKSVTEGRYYVSSILTEFLINRKNRTDVEPSDSFLEKLTQMELRILNMIAENKTSKKIADLLYVSHRTVQNHRSNICNKLNLKGHNRLLQFALENKNKFNLHNS